LVISKEVIREEQEKDGQCDKYREYEHFWLDDEGVLYRQERKEQPRVVIPATLVHTVIMSYHDLPFTAHQGVKRTVEFISRKYWWENLRKDVSEFIGKCYACARRKTGHRVTAPLGEAIVAKEFLDVVSLDVVGPFHFPREGINIFSHLLIILLDSVMQSRLQNRIPRQLQENLWLG
jgi:hypothetical protein